MPYLVGKKRQAELCLEFQSTKRRDLRNPGWKRNTPEQLAHRLALHTEIQLLNARREVLDAERLSEEAPLKPLRKGWKGDAIVRSDANKEASETGRNDQSSSVQ